MDADQFEYFMELFRAAARAFRLEGGSVYAVIRPALTPALMIPAAGSPRV
jgi:hypothetical protein